MKVDIDTRKINLISLKLRNKGMQPSAVLPTTDF
jgi:hypothetical protein